jgi:hypothetical protein
VVEGEEGDAPRENVCPAPRSSVMAIDESQIRALPKVELHVHLEGRFTLAPRQLLTGAVRNSTGG